MPLGEQSQQFIHGVILGAQEVYGFVKGFLVLSIAVEQGAGTAVQHGKHGRSLVELCQSSERKGHVFHALRQRRNLVQRHSVSSQETAVS